MRQIIPNCPATAKPTIPPQFHVITPTPQIIQLLQALMLFASNHPPPPTYLPTQHQHTDNIQFKFAPPRLIRPLHLLFYFLAAGLSSPLALNPSSPSQTSAVNFPCEDLENCQFETQLRSVVPSTNNSSSFTAAEISPTCRD